MGYLLDTHTILWVLENDNKLSSNARQVIENIQKDCFVSIASLFEIAIKRKIGKLERTKSKY
jgi:PIN domain nuclease of toxin-antitoxin system